MYTQEQKILKLSMVLLFLALMIVYILWYQIKGDILQQGLQQKNLGQYTGVHISIQTGNNMTNNSSQGSPISIGLTGTTTIPVNNTGNSGKTETLSSSSSGMTMKKITTIKVLSGTSIYYGPISIVEKLGITYQYALADEKGIWYIYLGTPNYDFASIARALKGSLYTLATEQDILQNKLFGNKVVFINLPEYKNKQVLMLVYLNDGIWLIQIDYTLYHKSKSYIKSLFID